MNAREVAESIVHMFEDYDLGQTAERWFTNKITAALESRDKQLAIARKAMKDVAPYLKMSDAIEVVNAVYYKPATVLKMAADNLELKDAAIKRFHAAMDEMGDV
jgi:hypothetical protein